MRSLIPLLLALAACDPTPANVAAPIPEGPSAFQNSVAALSEGERNLVFIRAIRDAGNDCQGVTSSERRDDAAGGQPLWVATCSGGATYGVLIGREGTAQVVAAR